jgi:SAM-dependent methyltransferase
MAIAFPSLDLLWRQFITEWRVARRGVRFRSTSGTAVRSAYAAMTVDEFDAINSRQQWANEQVIPRIVGAYLPYRVVTAIDLGCGTGGSTEVLARCCADGSTIIGYDQAPQLIERARRNPYITDSGRQAKVMFVCQSIVQQLHGTDGQGLEKSSVDFVLSRGVVGHHFDTSRLRRLLAELRRVLRPGGIVALDSGPILSLEVIEETARGFGMRRLGTERSCAFDHGVELILRRGVT